MTANVTPDDGETVGRLRRPTGGFRLTSPGEYLPLSGGGKESWLVAVGRQEARVWPREGGRFLDRFAGLHRGNSEGIRKFASQYGLLRSGTPLVRMADFTTHPVLGERLLDWQVESRLVGDLVEVEKAARGLQQAESALHRHKLMAHFQSGPSGAPVTLWVGSGQRVSGLILGTGVMEWQVLTDPDSRSDEQAVGFHYGGDRFELIRVPIPGGPLWGTDLAHVPRAELVEMSLYAVGAAMQRPLSLETHAVLTLDHGIRVAPHSLLGAVYLSLAGRLFKRDPGWRRCPACREGFRAISRKDQRYCSDACKAKAYRKRKAEN